MAFWTGLFGGKKSSVELGAPLTSLANLRLQIFSEDYEGVRVLDRNAMPVRPLAPGLVQALVEDLGAAERIVEWARLRPFGKSDDDLFELAREQAAANVGRIEHTLIESVQVFACNGFFMSASLLDTFIKQDLKKGILVVPVSSHHWCTHIIQSGITVPPHISMLRLIAGDLARSMKVSRAERLVTDVYWIRPGGRRIERIEMDGDEPVLSLDLAAALEWS
jgi:hypothetical protein